nr:DUF2946 family protein [Alkalilacustris brevis]
MTVARGMAPPDYTATLCTEAGIVTIHLDAEGNPTGPGHICPDCVIVHGALLPDQAEVVHLARLSFLRLTLPAEPAPRLREVWFFHPRAPPLPA